MPEAEQRPAKSAREAMVDAAWMLIAERGLEGMSTREVLARTGAPRGSVYHHFPGGRTQLIELALKRSQSWMRDQIMAIPAESPEALISGYVGIWRKVLESTAFRAGCAAVGVVTGGDTPHMLDLGAEAFDTAVSALASRFQSFGLVPESAASRATVLVCAAEGAVVLARAQRSTRPLDLVSVQLVGLKD
ncbi:TetR/AcrR family transcriptional regulator [Leifsonia sp. NPDC056665]|uniref:TetR/AcrR family transcriptional regulator n=1 Tax=Leifsonia sp. NPDC056665 TaxID=3345901 RepID=UPI00368640E0